LPGGAAAPRARVDLNILEDVLGRLPRTCRDRAALTLGADKAYDENEFVDGLRDLNVTPHIAQNTTNHTSAIDARTTRHPGYAISQQKRKLTAVLSAYLISPSIIAAVKRSNAINTTLYDKLNII
jgi:hypothetical protein